jgi:hypothetical protein
LPSDSELDSRPYDAPQHQHRCLRQISEALGRTLEAGLKECVGRAVPVHFAYQEPVAGKKPSAHVTVINYWVERVTDRNPDRVLCKTSTGEEYHRAAPLILAARYAISAWAPAPEDQELLMAAIRVLHDMTALEPTESKEENAVHWEDNPMPTLQQRFTLDEARLLAEAYGMPLRPSVRYDITFRLDSERKTRITRVKERIIDYKKLEG